MVVYFLSLLIGVAFFQPLGGIFDRFDTLRLRWIANLRTDSSRRVGMCSVGTPSSGGL